MNIIDPALIRLSLPAAITPARALRALVVLLFAAFMLGGAVSQEVGDDPDPASDEVVLPALDEDDEDAPDDDAPDEGDDEGSSLEIEDGLIDWEAQFRSGDYRKSGRTIDRLARDFPDAVEVQLAAARQAVMTGKSRKAGRILDDIVDAHADNLDAQSMRAELLIDGGDYEEAEQLLRKIVEADSNRLGSRFRLGLLLERELGRRSEATEVYGAFYDWWNALSFEDSQKVTAEQRYYLGMACWRYGDPHTALNEMFEATKVDGSLVEAFVGQGFLFLDKYDRPKARKEFESALQVNPRNPDAHCGIAACHLSEFGQIDQAEAALQQALRVNKRHLLALTLAAQARMDAQDYEGAGPHLESALNVNPNSIDALSLKAALAFLTSDTVEYKRIEELISARAPPAVSLMLTTVASYLAGRHRYPEAVAFGRRAIELDPKNSRAFVELGINMTRSGDDWEEGMKILEKAYEQDSFNVQVYNLLELLDDYDKDYVSLVSDNMIIRLHKSESEVIGYELQAILQEAYETLTKKYKVTLPKPIVIEMLPGHQDFSVRSVGTTGLGALGVCFGKVVTLLSPEGMKQKDPRTGEEKINRFNWGQTAWHEFVHVVTLSKTGSRIPRWFTEGLSVFEEKEYRGEWARELEIPVYDALMSDSLRSIIDLNEGFTRGSEIMLSYYVGSLVCEFIRDEFGFDKIVEMLDLYNQDLKTERVIEKALGFDYKEFDQRFKDYLHEIFADYALTPRFTKRNIAKWRDILETEVTPDEEVTLHAKLSNAYWFNNAVADAEIHAVKSINLYEAMDKATSEVEAAAASAYIVLARVFKDRDRLGKAKEFFDKAFELGSDDFFAHRTRAQIAQSDNEVDLAIEQYEAALAAFPRYASPPDSPYRQLYQLYLETGEQEKAYSMLEAFCRIDDSDLEVRKILAKHYAESGEDDKLREILRQARLITVMDPDVNRMQASAGGDADDSAARVRQIRSALGVPGLSASDRVRLLTDLAESLAEMGQLMDALDTIEEAIGLKEEYFRAEKVLAAIEGQISEDPIEGRRLQRRRLERKVEDITLDSATRAEAYVKLAKVLIEDDELYDAQDVLEEALELPIPVPEAEELLRQVQAKLDDDE